MADVGDSPIDIAALERAVREIDPAVRMVAPRILRRVIKHDREFQLLGLQVPHRHVYIVGRERLRALVDGAELGMRADEHWPQQVILVEAPEAREIGRTPGRVLLARYWRLVYHARIHVALEQKRSEGAITAAGLADRIARIGAPAFHEIRTVLRQEGLLLAPADDWSVYVEFAAYFLELTRFAPALRSHEFPGLDDRHSIEAMLADDVAEPALFSSSRPVGTSDPDLHEVHWGEDEDECAAMEELPIAAEQPASGAARRLLHRAALTGSKGNIVRAAILRSQAARRADPALADSVRAGARSELDRLVRRLARALALDSAEADRWRKALPALLERSSRGFWNPEARLLYDLQKVCVDHEREVFAVDLVGWISSWGETPIRRPQPHLTVVMIAHHLRSASRRLRSVRVAPEERARLAAVLHPAVERVEETLRNKLRGPLDTALEITGFRPRNLPERVAFRKLVEELLDRISSRGFLSLGDLRDGCSRSNLKIHDLSGPGEFLRGDHLLRADRALAQALDGVYRRGEIYLRALQRLSSMAFGTRVGRFLTRYVVLPYGGAFILLKGLEHLVELIVHHQHSERFDRLELPARLFLGTVAMAVINFPRFRQRFLETVRGLGGAIRTLISEIVAWLLRLPLLHFLFAGRLATLAWRFLLGPVLLTLPVWGLFRAAGVGERGSAIVGAIFFLEALVVVNSRLGRMLEEVLADEAVRFWHQLYRDLLPGLFRWVMSTFDTILEAVDRFLYAVDEWLRFRAGQGRAALACKAVLGAVWFFVAYLVRIYVNLLIEPQVNPIKHFPVVTVSHKIILPMSITLTRILAAPLKPVVGIVVGNFVAATTVVLLPGVFGFLVWELKENWRLYEANRRPVLGPVVVGDHGETIGRLLRPGFHSGTLPKLFAKLRKSERRWISDGRERAVLKHRETLHHVEESIRRFVDRDLLALVHESRTLGPLGIEAAHVAVATNRIRLELLARTDPARVWISFEERNGQLIAQVDALGWIASLSEEQRRAFETALVGLYKLSGIEWIRQAPDSVPGPPHQNGQALDPGGDTLLTFQPVTVTWSRWLDAWETEQSGQGPLPRFAPGLSIVPKKSTKRERPRRTSRRP